MEMRRLDVWVGRVAAAAGLAYVVLCSLWPLNASADEVAVRDRACLVVPGVLAYPVDAVMPTTPDPSAAARLVVALATIATLVLYRRWHDPDALVELFDERFCAAATG